MKRLQAALFLVIVLGLTAPAPGQWMFTKKAKANPLQRVPELILIVKTDSDERKRQHAAEELREYDTTTFAEIVPVLADVLKNDKKQSVRSEALTGLVKIRPATALAAHAIEKAAAEDDALRIRLTAKAALPKYHLALSLTKKSEPAAKTKGTEEPPLVTPAPPTVSGSPRPLPSLFPDK
jgi:HEAT repeats